MTLLTTSLAFGIASCGPIGNPFQVDPPATCDVAAQNEFVVEVMSDFYLWNTDLPADIDITAYDSPESLVSDLRQGVDRWTRVSDRPRPTRLFMEGKFLALGYRTCTARREFGPRRRTIAARRACAAKTVRTDTRTSTVA